jgi:hypothetical protein
MGYEKKDCGTMRTLAQGYQQYEQWHMKRSPQGTLDVATKHRRTRGHDLGLIRQPSVGNDGIPKAAGVAHDRSGLGRRDRISISLSKKAARVEICLPCLEAAGPPVCLRPHQRRRFRFDFDHHHETLPPLGKSSSMGTILTVEEIRKGGIPINVRSLPHLSYHSTP